MLTHKRHTSFRSTPCRFELRGRGIPPCLLAGHPVPTIKCLGAVLADWRLFARPFFFLFYKYYRRFLLKSQKLFSTSLLRATISGSNFAQWLRIVASLMVAR